MREHDRYIERENRGRRKRIRNLINAILGLPDVNKDHKQTPHWKHDPVWMISEPISAILSDVYDSTASCVLFCFTSCKGSAGLVSHPQRPHAEGSSLFDYHRNRQDLREIKLHVYSHYPAAVSALPLMCQNGTQPASHYTHPHNTLPPYQHIHTHTNITLQNTSLNCTN